MFWFCLELVSKQDTVHVAHVCIPYVHLSLSSVTCIYTVLHPGGQRMESLRPQQPHQSHCGIDRLTLPPVLLLIYL